MAHLITCIMCGAEVSSEIEKCPHCKKDPKTYTCIICKNRYSRDNMVQHYDNYSGMWKILPMFLPGNGICKNCISAHVSNNPDTVYFNCQVCKKPIYYNESKDSTINCPNCGHPYSLYVCDLCQRKVAYKFGVHISDGDYSANYHLSCNELWNKLSKKYNKNKGCFIATCVYGSEFDEEVIALKYFRDRILMSSLIGRIFVTFYYRVSPFIVKTIYNHSRLKNIIKYLILQPLVILIKKFNKQLQ